MPDLQGNAVIIAAQEAVFQEHVPGADHIDPVSVQNPVDQVDILDSDIGHIVNGNRPARGIYNGNILYDKIPPSRTAVLVALNQYFAAGPLGTCVREFRSGDDAVACDSAVAALNLDSSIKYCTIVHIQGLSLLENHLPFAMFTRAVVNHGRVIQRRFLPVGDVANQE